MTSTSATNWASTKLATRLHELSSIGEDEMQAWSLLQRRLPAIETILSRASTSPKDFTLHDELHSRRVAEWMVRIIPPSTFNALTGYECMLLLLSAYLHDIGMTPEQQRISRHLNHILFPKDLSRPNDWLSDDEAKAMQAWLDSD